MGAKDRLNIEIKARLMALRDATQVACEKGEYAPEIDGLAREITEISFKAGIREVMRYAKRNLLISEWDYLFGTKEGKAKLKQWGI